MPNRNKRIVVIDDSRTTLLLIENLLYEIDKHFEVLGFDKPEKGLEYLRHNSADLLLLDLFMPRVNGFDILMEIKSKFLLPVFIISAENKLESVERAFALGADEYFIKPLEIQKLLERLKFVLLIKKHIT